MPLPLIAAGAALAPILIKELPSIASWIFGDSTGKAVEKVTSAAREILGTDDPQQIEAAIARDPTAALQWKMALLQAEADDKRGEREELLALLHDVQNARDQTVKLAESHSPIAWGAPIISTVVLLTFSVMLYLVIAKPFAGADSQSAQMLLGMLGTMATAVVSYWVGSSRSSASKDAALAQAARSR
jgi:hypothetical protein